MKNKYYEDNDSWDWGKFLQGEITHWMPLPQPPEVLTPHVMRHTFCTRMAMSGMNPQALQYVMGHSDIKMTLGYYTHMTSEGGAGRDGALRHLSAGGTTEFTTFGVVNLEKDRENYQGRLFKRWRERPFYAASEPSGRFQRPLGK